MRFNAVVRDRDFFGREFVNVQQIPPGIFRDRGDTGGFFRRPPYRQLQLKASPACERFRHALKGQVVNSHNDRRAAKRRRGVLHVQHVYRTPQQLVG